MWKPGLIRDVFQVHICLVYKCNIWYEISVFRIPGTGLGFKMGRACYTIRSPKETKLFFFFFTQLKICGAQDEFYLRRRHHRWHRGESCRFWQQLPQPQQQPDGLQQLSLWRVRVPLNCCSALEPRLRSGWVLSRYGAGTRYGIPNFKIRRTKCTAAITGLKYFVPKPKIFSCNWFI